MLIEYIVLIALIIGKTAAGMGRRTDPEEHMIYAGIDIAKNKFDYCIIDSGLNRIGTGIIINNDTGFREFLKIIETYDNIRIGMESTNIYHVNLYNCLIENGYSPMLLNSIETRMMKRSRIRRNKTDKIDSEAIAKYLIISKNKAISMVEYPELKQYVSTYFRLTRKLTAVKNQLIRDLDLLYPGMTSIVNIDTVYFNDIINNIDNIINDNYRVRYLSSEKYGILRSLIIMGNRNNIAVNHDIRINMQTMELLNNQMKETMELIEEQYSNINSKINTIPGIGTLTGSVILSSIGDINRFESIVKLRAYTGMDPVTKQSGEYSISSYISKSGNPLLRYALYLSTVSAIRFNPVVRRYYIRKKEQGMKGNKLMIACANKLLNIIYSVMKNNTDFKDPELVN
jgi:transposase